MRRKNLYIVLGVLALFLLTAVVYAAATGTLTFNGTAILNPDVKVEFYSSPPTTPTITGGVDTANNEEVTVGNDGQDLSFTVYLEEPGASKTVTFELVNTGKVDAILGALVDTTTPALPTGIDVTWPTLTDVVVPADNTPSATYSIVVLWDIGAEDLAATLESQDYQVHFSATVDYAQAP